MGTPCPHCKERPRRAPGLSCLPCEAAAKRRRRAAIREKRQRAAPKFKRKIEGARRYIITSAQNATPVDPNVWASLQVAAKHLDAQLVVIPLRYKNPTSQWTQPQEDHEWWVDEVKPYLDNQRHQLGPNLVLAGDVKTQPTASRPLSGFEALTGAESCIVGHPKMQFRSVPSPLGRFPKILTTTGSCTKPNFTDTKAGKLGEFHHFSGGILVELDGRRFHLRQLNADRRTGEFTDLGTLYTPTGARRARRAAGLVLGDLHERFVDPLVDAATFGEGGIVETLNPEHIVFHDLFDGYSVNPHHEGNPFVAIAKGRTGYGNVEEEIRRAVEYVISRCRKRKAVIVASNHDNFLARWVAATDWRRSPGNAEFYLETALAMAKATRMTAGGVVTDDPLKHWVERMRGDAWIRCLGSDETFDLVGVECGQHGDRGPNGARGSLRNLSRVGARLVTGHSHTPGIEEGHYQCGTSTPLKLEYTRGPSSWLNTHCVIYANGKRSLITIVDGKWRAPK